MSDIFETQTEKESNSEQQQNDEKNRLPTLPQRRVIPFEKPQDLSSIEKVLNQLVEELSELEELRTIVEEVNSSKSREDDKFKSQVVNYFNNFNTKADLILDRMVKEVDYSQSLQDKVEKHQALMQVNLLEKQLITETASISAFITEITKTVNEKLELYEQKVLALESVTDTIDKKINEFKAEVEDFSKNELDVLQASFTNSSRKFTDDCCKKLEIVKNQSVDFIKQCESENKKLIEKVPEVKEKYSVKDILICALCVLTVIIHFV